MLAAIVIAAPQTAAEEVTFTRPGLNSSIEVSGERMTRWIEGGYEILHVVGSPVVRQGQLTAQSNEMILWIEIPADPLEQLQQDQRPFKVIAYLEGDVVIDIPRAGPAHRETDFPRFPTERGSFRNTS